MYLVRIQIEKLLSANPPSVSARLLSGGKADWERHAFWGDDPLPESFWQHLTLQGLFNTPKALVIHNAHAITADVWRSISSTLGKPNENVWPFFCLLVPFERGKPKIPAHIAKLQCMLFAEKKGWVWLNPGLDEKGKASFFKQEAEKRGLSLAPGALEALCARLPLDAMTIASELDKLSLAVPPGGVLGPESADILTLTIEPDVFSLIRSIQSGRHHLAVWEQVLSSTKDADSMTFPFLAMLSREARQLWQIQCGEPVRLPPQVLTAKTGLARSLGLGGIAKLWQIALEADKGIKTGERSVDQALEMVLASLSKLFAQKTAAPRN